MRVVLTHAGDGIDQTAYLQAMLHACGVCCVERLPLRDALRTETPEKTVLIVSGDAPEIAEFARAGAQVIAIRPEGAVAEVARAVPERAVHGVSARLRLTAPVGPASRAEPLWTPGARTVYTGTPDEILAYLFEPGQVESEAPGIFRTNVGDGSITVFAYDLALCIGSLRQGLPERVGMMPPGEKIPRSIQLHIPNPPQDAAWRPTADLHAQILTEVVRQAIEREMPLPTLWHLPDGRPSMLIFSGDEDCSKQEENDVQMAAVESFGGAMSLYIIPDDTSMTREGAEGFERRGHTISVHPNLLPTVGRPADEQVARARDQVELFKKTIGFPVRTVRGHNTMWPGYLDLPELWQEIGVGMDANCMATLFRLSPDFGPYVNVNAAIPLPFVRQDGSLIDVFQQPTHVNDDVSVHPRVFYSQKFSAGQFEQVSERIFEDSERFFHSPVCVNFHPCNFVEFSGEAAKATLESAHRRDLPIWSLDRWHDFWRARSTWTLQDFDWSGDQLRWKTRGATIDGLYLMVPAKWRDRELKAVTLNGQPVEVEEVRRYGRLMAQFLSQSGEAEIVARYAPAE